MNQIDVSNTNNIFPPPSTPINRKEDQPQQDFNETVENEFKYSRKFRYCKGFGIAASTATANTTTTASV